jgi:hypothetical protein
MAKAKTVMFGLEEARSIIRAERQRVHHRVCALNADEWATRAARGYEARGLAGTTAVIEALFAAVLAATAPNEES